MKSRSSPLEVLIVDDSEGNLDLLEAIVEQPGVKTIRAGSGQEALQLAKHHDFALAVLDVNMPGMNGFELAERLRAEDKTRGLALLFLTAAPHDNRWAFRGFELGAVDFLFKPVEAALIRYKVNAFLELHRQRIQIEENLRINEVFVAVMAHDLRNPLSAIVMGADLLARAKDPMQADVASKIKNSARRMGTMIEQLCDLSQARLAGGIRITRQPTDLSAALTHTLQEAELANPGRVFETRIGSDLRGDWDPDRLEQILSNLIGNAVRHGRPETPIRISTSADEASVTFAIENGGEVPIEHKEQLFEPFKTMAPTKARRQGLGLGLYIVQQLVEAHGGRIDVSSGDGRTTFTVALPRAA